MEALIPTTSYLHLSQRPDSYPFSFSSSSSSPSSSATKPTTLSFKKPYLPFPNRFHKLKTSARTTISARASVVDYSTAAAAAETSPSASTRWMVVMEKPPNAENSSRAEIIDYYVQALARVLPSEKEAQMCIYRASWQMDFFFCCDMDEGSSQELARLPGVMSVTSDRDVAEAKKDYKSSNIVALQSNSTTDASRFSPSAGHCAYWLVKMEKPGVEVVTKAQMVDYFAQTLMKVLGNEKDAQACMYNISWEKDYGFCCQIDDECARELSDVPGVLFVQPDENFASENKNYKVDDMPTELHDTSETTLVPVVKTKRLFVTGLSFYTSEKTLRAAFEPFGELVEVKIIMDKISKRSKGYAFIEYTTEEAAGAALREMNGKIINGWMIVVDVAKTNPPRYNRGRPSTSSSYTY